MKRFIGENTLLIEGPSDLIYLDVLSDAAEAAGRTGLDPQWVKTPIGGSGKLSTFASLLGANKLNVAVLIQGHGKVAHRGEPVTPGSRPERSPKFEHPTQGTLAPPLAESTSAGMAGGPTTVFVILAALGGLVGATLSIVNWIAS